MSHDTLPASISEFKELVAAQRNDESLDDLYELVKREGRARNERAPMLLEKRLLEIVRQPRIAREWGDRELWFAQQCALRDLAERDAKSLPRLLNGWLRDDDDDVRSYAAQFLAHMGRNAHVAKLKRLGREGHAVVVERLAGGVECAKSNRTAEAGFLDTMFDAMTPCVTGVSPLSQGTKRQQYEAYGAVARMLLMISRRRAFAILAGPSAIHVDNPAVDAIVSELESDLDDSPKAVRGLIDAQAVWATYDAFSKRRLSKPRARAVGSLLVIGAHVDPVKAAAEEPELRGHDDPFLVRRLDRVTQICKGVPSMSTLINKYIDRKLKPQAQAVVTAYVFGQQVLGEGVEGCLGNIGHEWKSAHKGLHVIGQAKAADALKACAGIPFASRRLKSNDDAWRLLEAMTPKQRQAFDKAAKKLWDHAGDMMTAAERYIGANPAKFA